MTRWLIILFAVIFALGCKKTEVTDDEPLGPVSATPSISLVSVKPTTVVEFQDSIVFTIFYVDGDGDIGFEEADSMSLYLTDNRVPFTEEYHIPPQAPSGTNIAIQGNLKVVLNHTALLDTAGVDETTTYSIQIRDRANRWSNIVTSGTVTITR